MISDCEYLCVTPKAFRGNGSSDKVSLSEHLNYSSEILVLTRLMKAW